MVSDAQAAGRLRADEDAGQLAFEINAYLLMGNTGFLLNDDPIYLRRTRTALNRRLEQAA